jgi:hypothetical protein
MSGKKVFGGEAFDSLLRRVVAVSKEEADLRAKQWKKKRAVKKKKKPKQ